MSHKKTVHIGDLRFQRKASGQSKRLGTFPFVQTEPSPTHFGRELPRRYRTDKKRGSFTRNARYTTFYAVISLLQNLLPSSDCLETQRSEERPTTTNNDDDDTRTHTTQSTFSSLEKCHCLKASRYVE